MKKKKFLCLVIAVAVVAIMIPSATFASDTTLPPPINVSVYTTNGKNILTWSEISGAGGYIVYRQSQYESWEKCDQTTSLRSIDNSRELIPDVVYYYKIHTYQNNYPGKDIESADSEVVSVKYKLPASKITTLSRNSRTSLKVYWGKVSSADGYNIYQKKDSKGKWKKIKTITKNSTLNYTVKKLKRGSRYYYKVRAYKTYGGHTGYSSYSSIKSKKL